MKDISEQENIFTSQLPIIVRHFHTITSKEAPFMQTQMLHKHNFFELHFILQGEISYLINAKNTDIKQGSSVLIAPNTEHKIEYFSNDMIKCSVAFSVDSAELLHSELCKKSGQSLPITKLSDDIIRACRLEAERNTEYSATVIKCLLFSVICSMADLRERRGKNPGSGAVDTRLLKAKQFISDNQHVFLGCEEIAVYCHLSAKQLNRIFLKFEGISLLKYIHTEKIRSAKELLAQPSISLKDVSDSLGFSSVYYFTGFFTKHTGLTPKAYRNGLSTKNASEH